MGRLAAPGRALYVLAGGVTVGAGVRLGAGLPLLALADSVRAGAGAGEVVTGTRGLAKVSPGRGAEPVSGRLLGLSVRTPGDAGAEALGVVEVRVGATKPLAAEAAAGRAGAPVSGADVAGFRLGASVRPPVEGAAVGLEFGRLATMPGVAAVRRSSSRCRLSTVVGGAVGWVAAPSSRGR